MAKPEPPDKTVSRVTSEAIQSLVDSAEDMAKKSAGTQKTILDSISKENEVFKRRNKWLMTVLIVLTVISIYREWRWAFVNGPDLAAVNETVNGPLSHANERLDRLVAELEEEEANQAGTIAFVSGLVKHIENILKLECEAHPVSCQRLGIDPNVSIPFPTPGTTTTTTPAGQAPRPSQPSTTPKPSTSSRATTTTARPTTTTTRPCTLQAPSLPPPFPSIPCP